MSATTTLLLVLGLLGVGFLVVWLSAARKRELRLPRPLEIAIGFGTNFFDTLGIGSFATTTSMFKLWRVVPDQNIPGTLNVGHTVPTIVQALIFISIVRVDPTTLCLLIVAATAGAWFGAGVVANWPRSYVQVGMGAALLTAAALFLLGQPRLFSNRRHRACAPRAELVVRCRNEFLSWCADDFGNRAVRAVYDSDQPAGNEPRYCISHYDGVVCILDAGRRHAIHSFRQLRTSSVVWIGVGRHPSSVDCGLPREIAAIDRHEMARHHRRRVCGHGDAAFGIRGTPEARPGPVNIQNKTPRELLVRWGVSHMVPRAGIEPATP
ncbi:MAG: hypothetical protein ACXVAL_05380 [Vulcanimicrobiaceae bacterium]